MPSVEDINWNKVSLKKGITQEMVIRAYEEAAKDIVKLNQEFDRFFSGKKKKASRPMPVASIFDIVQYSVFYNLDDQIDVHLLLTYIPSDDKYLFADICTFVYQFFHEKPKTSILLEKFKGLLVYYLCKAEF
jgi:hypothetical protein